MTLPEPECRVGYTYRQLEAILEDRLEDFWDWMWGQTMMLCNAEAEREWTDDAGAPGGMRLVEVGPALCAEPHGGVVYTWDLERYLSGRQIID